MSSRQIVAPSRKKTSHTEPRFSLYEKKKRIILIGLGPHSQRIYYPLLQKHAQEYNIEIPLIVDLKSQAVPLQNYLSNYSPCSIT